MKKVLLILAVAGFAVACNNSGEEKPAEDTTATEQPVTPPVDTTATTPVDTTAAADTTAK